MVSSLGSSWSQPTEILLHTLRTAPLTLSTESPAAPVPDGDAPPVGPATPLTFAWVMWSMPSWVVVMAQLMLEDGDGGVCVSTTKVVGVPETSETSDGMIAVGRTVVAAMVWLAVVGSAVAGSAAVTLLSPVTVSWARATEPASASTKSREAMVGEDGLDECSQGECSGHASGKFSPAGVVAGDVGRLCFDRYVRSGCGYRPSQRSRAAGCPWLKKDAGEQKEGREDEPVKAAAMFSENRQCLPSSPLLLRCPRLPVPSAEAANDVGRRGRWPASMETQTKDEHQAAGRERGASRVSPKGRERSPRNGPRGSRVENADVGLPRGERREASC